MADGGSSLAGSPNAERAALQGMVWGARARDWAAVQEPFLRPLYTAALNSAGVGSGSRLLDVGCGAGLACAMAEGLGARAVGIDVAAGLVQIAHERGSGAQFAVADMNHLPFPDACFQVVTGFQSFRLSSDVVSALREARRVTTSDGRVVLTAPAEDVGLLAVFMAARQAAHEGGIVSAQAPLPAAEKPGSSPESLLATLASQAGMEPIDGQIIDCMFEYPDEETLLRGLLSFGPVANAVRVAGEELVRAAVLEAALPRRSASGSYRLGKKVLYLVARA